MTDIVRRGFDKVYDIIKPVVFRCLDGERAHGLFVGALNSLDALGFTGLVLDNSANRFCGDVKISNATGFNKNGEISPKLMRLLGFDRSVIGTVTGEPWEGNPKPRIKRYVESGSMVNWMGLPGEGAEAVARRMDKYGGGDFPLTINLMATPGKSGDAVLDDLMKTVDIMSCFPNIDRYELNISCPNTHGVDGRLDARREYVDGLGDMIYAVKENMSLWQDLYLKVSPDLVEVDVDRIWDCCDDLGNCVSGYVTANTTTEHDPNYIFVSPGKGGASGNAVWDASVRTQKYFADRVGDDVKLIACGGINSVERMKERTAIGNCDEVQIFTGLVFKGTGLLRKLQIGS